MQVPPLLGAFEAGRRLAVGDAAQIALRLTARPASGCVPAPEPSPGSPRAALPSRTRTAPRRPAAAHPHRPAPP
ncbi:MAG TPA: hypothetical protein PKA17_08015, partial [Phenylobacterium sp.]|nr:hypothetical protein [Phenylobacterium sp.]